MAHHSSLDLCLVWGGRTWIANFFICLMMLKCLGRLITVSPCSDQSLATTANQSFHEGGRYFFLSADTFQLHLGWRSRFFHGKELYQCLCEIFRAHFTSLWAMPHSLARSMCHFSETLTLVSLPEGKMQQDPWNRKLEVEKMPVYVLHREFLAWSSSSSSPSVLPTIRNTTESSG